MYYIEETDKLSKIDKIFKIIKINDNKIILPINEETVSAKYQKKLAIKTNEILTKTNSNKIVVSNQIKKYDEYINFLNSCNIDIADGKWLYKIAILDILDYIVNNKNIKKEELEIAITTNYISDIEIENIKRIAFEYKRVNVITNHIEKLKKIEQNLYEEHGIMITVSNNKKKSLRKSEIIVNFDFPKELLNKYNIYEEAIIINVEGNMKITKKRFNGLVINDFEIEPKESSKYSAKEIYESKFFKKQNFKYVREKMAKDNIKISELIGNNGKIM